MSAAYSYSHFRFRDFVSGGVQSAGHVIPGIPEHQLQASATWRFRSAFATIEALGKLTRVPYWQCLSIEPTNPTFKAEARQWFDLMGADERERFVKDGLARAGYYRGSASGAPAVTQSTVLARMSSSSSRSRPTTVPRLWVTSTTGPSAGTAARTMSSTGSRSAGAN